MKRNLTLSGFALCWAFAVSSLLSGCSFFSDPIVGIWKVDKPWVHYLHESSYGVEDKAMSQIGGNITFVGPYAFQFFPNHTLVVKLGPGWQNDSTTFKWERDGDTAITLSGGPGGVGTGPTVRAKIEGDHLVIEDFHWFGYDLSGRYDCTRVDSMPDRPATPKEDL